MEIDPEQRRRLADTGQQLSRGLVLALVIGVVALLGLLVWFLRMSGGMWR